MKEALEKAGLKTHLMIQPLAYLTPDCGKQGFIDLPEFPFGEFSINFLIIIIKKSFFWLFYIRYKKCRNLTSWDPTETSCEQCNSRVSVWNKELVFKLLATALVAQLTTYYIRFAGSRVWFPAGGPQSWALNVKFYHSKISFTIYPYKTSQAFSRMKIIFPRELFQFHMWNENFLWEINFHM